MLDSGQSAVVLRRSSQTSLCLLSKDRLLALELGGVLRPSAASSPFRAPPVDRAPWSTIVAASGYSLGAASSRAAAAGFGRGSETSWFVASAELESALSPSERTARAKKGRWRLERLLTRQLSLCPLGAHKAGLARCRKRSLGRSPGRESACRRAACRGFDRRAFAAPS